jgi:RNA polymerase sigma factor (sigma-70 family)
MTDFDKLVLRAQQGSRAAMNTVINYMYKILTRKTKETWKELSGGHALEDIVQYAMIEVFDAIKTYNGKGSAINWIWMHAKNEIFLQARYLNYNKRKANLVSSSLDNPVNAGKESDEPITLGSMLRGKTSTENEAIGNVYSSNLMQYLKSELSELELTVMDYMIREYPTRDIAVELGYPSRAVVNTKERIKVKVRRYLAVS